MKPSRRTTVIAEDGTARRVSRKAKGNVNEWKTIGWLEERGHQCTRSGQSLGMWDVIALSPQEVLVIQVKTNRPPPRGELEAIAAFAAPPGVRKQVWVWRDGVHEPQVTDVP